MYELTQDEQLAIAEYLDKKGMPQNVAITFDDIYIPENWSDLRSRREAFDFSGQLTDNFELKLALISANMESVTGVNMITELERLGGLGVPPQTLAISDRIEILDRAGRKDCALITNPLKAGPDVDLRTGKKLMSRYGVSSLILVDEHSRPVGIVTSRDWRYESDDSRPLHKLAGRRKLIVAGDGVSFDEAAKILIRNRIEKLPLVDKRGVLKGLITARGLFYNINNPWATRDKNGRFILCGSVGVGKYFDKAHLLEVERQAKKGIGLILVDTARALSVNAQDAVETIRKNFPHLILIAGNVSSAKGAKALFEWGAHAVKVNQGRGHVCRTSKNGVGQPQLTTIAECKAIAIRYGRRIVGDGGMKNPGDMVKAIMAGADCLMSGFMLVGTHESAAQPKFNKDGFLVKTHVGSASLEAQRSRIKSGTLDEVREPEGVSEDVPIVGSLESKVKSDINGIRSAMSYLGVRTFGELRSFKCRFDKLQTRSGLFEGTKEKK